jgi:hypothetical protein
MDGNGRVVGRRPRLRATIIALAAVTLALFVGGIVYAAVRGPDRPCGDKAPLKERPGMLGQTEYLCPDGRTVTS